jgi:hypothetical protein
LAKTAAIFISPSAKLSDNAQSTKLAKYLKTNQLSKNKPIQYNQQKR